MVIFQTPDGSPGYNQFESVEEAVTFVEKLRNDQGIENARMFALEEIKFELKPYFKVELQALNPGAQPAPAPAAAPSAAAPSAAAPSAPSAAAPSAPAVGETTSFGAGAPAAAPAPTPAPPPSESPSSAPAPEGQPTRRGLFGR